MLRTYEAPEVSELGELAETTLEDNFRWWGKKKKKKPGKPGKPGMPGRPNPTS